MEDREKQRDQDSGKGNIDKGIDIIKGETGDQAHYDYNQRYEDSEIPCLTGIGVGI